MSEPLTTTEIEDVLSSIRRLVADDLRPSVPSQPRPGDGVRNKLILTPALRVVATDSDERPATDMAAVVSNLGSGLTQAEWEPEADDVTSAEEGLILGADQGLADHGWAVAEPEMTRAEEEENGVVAMDDSDLHHEETASATASAVVTEFTDAREKVEPTFVSVRRTGVAHDVPGWAQPGEIAEDVTDESQPDAVAGTIEPDPEWADAAEADVRAELELSEAIEAPVSFSANPMNADGASGPVQPDSIEAEPIYDEVLLREIVRDLMREELQGTIGERITRNIRKLVRAEIARALATQDLT